MNNKFDSLKDDDSGDHDQNEENSTQKDGEKEKTERDKSQGSSKRKVEQFWRFYSHMVRPGDLTGHSDFHLFKEGIKPMWEDDANKKWWQVDYSTAEGLGIPLLGESHPGHVGGNSSWLGRRSVGLWSLSGFRRTLFQYGIRLPVTKQPQPASGIPFGKCLTYLPTPLWSTKPTPTASKCQAGWAPQRLLFQNLWKPRLNVP
ncbi:Eukaryotic translation initiation factor 4E type 2 [Vulpes lagopus]